MYSSFSVSVLSPNLALSAQNDSSAEASWTAPWPDAPEALPEWHQDPLASVTTEENGTPIWSPRLSVYEDADIDSPGVSRFLALQVRFLRPGYPFPV